MSLSHHGNTQPNIDQEEHTHAGGTTGGAGAKRVISGDIYATEVDTTSTANMVYIGKAVVGTPNTSSAWMVKRIDTSTGASINFADGDAKFDNIWDNRTSLSYS